MSCYSSSLFFYGTFVKAIPFYVASDIWDKAKPVFLALDMINSRRIKGNLRVEDGFVGKTSAVDIPVEVWDLVRCELVDLERVDAERRMSEPYTYSADDSRNEAPPWSECAYPFSCKCGSCFEDLFGNRVLETWREEYDSLVTAMLRDFGFGVFQLRSITVKEDTHADDDLDGLVPLSLPLFTSIGRPFLGTECITDLTQKTASEYLRFDPSALALPANAYSRFRRFLNLFHLETYDPASRVVWSPFSSDPRHARRDKSVPRFPTAEEILEGQQGEVKLSWYVGGWTNSYHVE
ncbi:hypothetical protein JCM8097_000330 [Rhodosporidiobolus ruineniae]